MQVFSIIVDKVSDKNVLHLFYQKLISLALKNTVYGGKKILKIYFFEI